MIKAKQFVLTLAMTLSALIASVQAQTPRMATVNITPDAEKVRISAIGDVSEIRINISDESGDLVFQSGAIMGETLDWKMNDASGERVAPGTYLVTVTFRAAGKLRRRVEQVTVAEDEKGDARPAAAPEAMQAAVMTAGTTTTGRLAKFASASTITNSIITESAGKIGIGTTAPVAKLTVTGASAGAVIQATNSGTTAGGGSGVSGSATAGYGVQGTGLVGVFGSGGNNGTGVQGVGRSGIGVLGQSINDYGVSGSGSTGVYGKSTTSAGTGVNGEGGSTGRGVLGVGFTGVQGIGSGDGVSGISNSASGTGISGVNNHGGLAGYFRGGVKIAGPLDVDGGCTGCSAPSDRNLKANFSTVNPRFILDRLATIPIQTWNYKSEPTTVRHIGAMAQDFRAAFGLGKDDKTLNTVDANGVTMAAIQGLYQMMLEKERQIEQQSSQIESLTQQVQQQQVQLNQVKRAIKRKRTATKH